MILTTNWSRQANIFATQLHKTHQVIDNREGLPITLSVLFIELAERLGIPGVTGLPLPGHFLVRHAPKGEPVQLIDVFGGGTRMSFVEADQLAETLQQSPVDSEQMQPASKLEIVRRILTNLKYGAQTNESFEKALESMQVNQICLDTEMNGLEPVIVNQQKNNLTRRSP